MERGVFHLGQIEGAEILGFYFHFLNLEVQMAFEGTMMEAQTEPLPFGSVKELRSH